MGKKKRNTRYTAAQRKAYYMGYGVGLVEKNNKDLSDEFGFMVDDRMGAGQRPDLCESARKGYFDAKKQNRSAPPFSKGFKRYPVTDNAWLGKK